MNRIQSLFQQKKDHVLSVYFTAGHPNIDSTTTIIEELENSGADLIEIGIPFSDPLADGKTIQDSSGVALENGMTLSLLFSQLKDIRTKCKLPLILMGYFNPILQFGIEAFAKECEAVGVDGLIIPDLPVEVYHEQYQTVFEQHGLLNIFLITPQTSEKRIRYMDSISKGFIYTVSSASTTGSQIGFGKDQTNYFKRIVEMNLDNPQIIGFGISNQETFSQATKYAKGAIIGSAFIKFVSENGVNDLKQFIEPIVKKL